MSVFAPVRNGFFRPSREFRDSRTRYYGIREPHQQFFFCKASQGRNREMTVSF